MEDKNRDDSNNRTYSHQKWPYVATPPKPFSSYLLTQNGHTHYTHMHTHTLHIHQPPSHTPTLHQLTFISLDYDFSSETSPSVSMTTSDNGACWVSVTSLTLHCEMTPPPAPLRGQPLLPSSALERLGHRHTTHTHLYAHTHKTHTNTQT